MNINSGVFIGDGDLVAVGGRHALWLLRKDCEPHAVVSGYEGIRFLTASPRGKYIAFWSDTGESFRLIDLAGQEIWSRWMNTDKAPPHAIQFSTLGDAVAFIYDFEGLHGLFFYDIKQGYRTLFGCSNSPIGYDADLKYFIVDRCDPYEDGKLAFYEHDASSKSLIKLPPEVVSARMKENPLVVGRNRCLYPYLVVPIRDWAGLSVQSGMEGIEGFVILKDHDLHWLAKDSDKPDATVSDCLPHEKSYEWYFCTLAACGDIALIQSVRYGGAIIVDRNLGRVWQGKDQASVMLKGQRVLAQYSSGTVEVIRSDGSVDLKCTPPSGFTTVAADVLDNVLRIAYMSENDQTLELKAYGLGQRGA
jgi:hypothetical protein